MVGSILGQAKQNHKLAIAAFFKAHGFKESVLGHDNVSEWRVHLRTVVSMNSKQKHTDIHVKFRRKKILIFHYFLHDIAEPFYNIHVLSWREM